MKALNALLLLIVLLLAGCAAEQTAEEGEEQSGFSTFTSESYGFSFDYPGNWEEVKKDLPDNWAIVKGDNTIIFTVNEANVENLLVLGKVRALNDLYPENTSGVAQEKVDAVNEIVKTQEFNNKTWYTYAIEFSSREVSSVVSGTICAGKEVNMVLVSGGENYELNRELYRNVLETFSCEN